MKTIFHFALPALLALGCSSAAAPGPVDQSNLSGADSAAKPTNGTTSAPVGTPNNNANNSGNVGSVSNNNNNVTASMPAPNPPISGTVVTQSVAVTERRDTSAPPVYNPGSAPAPRVNSGAHYTDIREHSSDPVPDATPSDGDRIITQQIQQAMMDNSALSYASKQVQIITVGGKVTLRGAVKTPGDRSTIDALARKLAGNANVENHIELKQ